MDSESFETLLQYIRPMIVRKNTHIREAVSARERLVATLRYLATGRCIADLKFSCAISPQLLGSIIPETCWALFKALKKEYMKFPSSEAEWLEISDDFNTSWNFEHCLGAMDGKHIAIKKPPNSGSFYYNYKGFYSTVLFAVVNANYEFMYVYTGINGRISDGGVLQETDFYEKLENHTLNIPLPSSLDKAAVKLPYVFIGDDAFSLTENVMKPYSLTGITHDAKIFNYRLCRARRVVENVFGILATRFRILLSTITLNNLEKIDAVVLACCILHNFLRRNCSNYMNTRSIDTVNSDGDWREELRQLQNLQNRRTYYNEMAKNVRNAFKDYYNHEGKIQFQDNMIN
nr:putative nuclease HARBI1 [Onthophagus taurus]